MTKCFFYSIRKVRLRLLKSKSNEVVKKITIKLKEILRESPDFTGDINISFCLGGLTGIYKREKMKIK